MALDTSSPQAYSASGGTLINGQIPTQQAPTGQPTSAIPADQLGQTTPLAPVPSTPSGTDPNFSGVISTAAEQAAADKAQADAAAKAATPITNEATGLLTKIKESLGLDTGKTAYEQQQLDTSGATALTKRQNEISGQLTALNNESQAIPMQAVQNATGMGNTRSSTSIESASALRANAIKALTLKSEYDVNAGNLQTAKDNAQRAVDLKYKDLETSIDQNTKLLQLYSPFMSAEQKAQADKVTAANEAKKTELADKKKQQTDVINAAQTAATNGIAGASQLASDALRLDPSSSTFANDLAGIQAKIGTSSIKDTQVVDIGGNKVLINSKTGETIKNLGGASGNGGSSDHSATILSYAQQYASNGAIPSPSAMKADGVTFAEITKIASELPKVSGQIVDNNTNIKSGKLTATQEDAYGALRDLTTKLDEAKTLFNKLTTGVIGGTFGNLFPTQDRQAYNTLRSEIVDLLARARTGAAISASEEALYKSKVPGTFNQTLGLGTGGANKIEGLKNSIAGKLDSQLRANGVSMYGFSKVKIQGNDYTVGQIIDINGHQGRINPNGSITTLN